MELSKIQIVALCVITTILTDKFLISHPSPNTSQNNSNQNPITTISPLPTQPVSTVSSTPTTNNNSQNEIILRELVNLRQDFNSSLGEIKKQSTDSATVSTLNPSVLKGMVKISSSQWKRVDVYDKASTSGKIINSLVYDTIYFYRQKQGDWYQIDLDFGQTGWVQSQFLKEFP